MNKTEARTALKQGLLECPSPTGLLSSDRSLPRELSNRRLYASPSKSRRGRWPNLRTSKIPHFRALFSKEPDHRKRPK
jgi:hypothetical protein